MEYKKELRRMNKLIRQMNDDIKNDSLWRGRFYARQKYVQHGTYPDDHHSIWCFFVYEFIDLKTGFKKDVYFDPYSTTSPFLPGDIFRKMNDFIVEDCKVWDEPDVNTDKTVWRK